MISIQRYKKILDSGLLLDHYLVLCNMRDGKEMPTSKRIGGFINLLNKKGYIEDGSLTNRAYELIDVHGVMIVEEMEVETPKFDYAGWVTTLHKKCEGKVVSLTGKRQVMAKIKKTDRKGYPFMCNATDFGARLLKVIQEYKLKDMDSIERAMLVHIDKCHSTDNWFPIMKYYIHKQGEGSPLVTDLEVGFDDVVEGTGKTVQKFI